MIERNKTRKLISQTKIIMSNKPAAPQKTTLEHYIDTWNKEISDAKRLIAKNEELINFREKHKERFPDLDLHVGRWNKIAWMSKSVNSTVDQFESRFNCGCCEDSPLEIWLYTMVDDQKIYSSPAQFRLGEKDYYSKEYFSDKQIRLSTSWEEYMKSKNINEKLIEKIRSLIEIKSEATFEDDYYEE